MSAVFVFNSLMLFSGMATWVTVDEAQRILGVSQRTVYRWISNGQLTSEKRGKSTFVLIDESQDTADSSSQLADKVAALEAELKTKNHYIEHLESEVDYLRQGLAATLSQNQKLIEAQTDIKQQVSEIKQQKPESEQQNEQLKTESQNDGKWWQRLLRL